MRPIAIAAVFMTAGMSPTAALEPYAFDLQGATLADIGAALDLGVTTSVELVGLYSQRIDAYDKIGPSLNAIRLTNPGAMSLAQTLDYERRTTGSRGPLHGVPILIKDLYDEEGMPNTGGSRALEGSIPPDNSFIVQQILDAGGIPIARTNLDEFAAGLVGFSSLGGQILNAWDTERVPFGSSGGTAVGVAADFAPIGIGSETEGSIRHPAAAAGLVGISPTFGLTSRDGVLPLSFNRDRTGPIARSVTDAAIMLDVIVGQDPADPTTDLGIGHIPETYTAFLNTGALAGARIGVVSSLTRRSGEITDVFNKAIADMETAGAEFIDVSGISRPGFSDIYFSLEYGLSEYLDSLGANKPFNNAQELLASGLVGEHLTPLFPLLHGDIAPEDDPDYWANVADSEAMKSMIVGIMDDNNLDALVYPTGILEAPTLSQVNPFDVGQNSNVASVAGLSSLSVPAGHSETLGLPVGIDFMGRPFDEGTLIELSYSFEQLSSETRFPETTPPLFGEHLIFGDFNRDGILTSEDIDLLALRIREQSNDLLFDIAMDAGLDGDDLTKLVVDGFSSFIGDANLDEKVDSDDFTLWSQNFGQIGGWSNGDFDGSGVVTGQDFLLFQSNFGEMNPSTGASVPEPNFLPMSLTAIFGALCRRKRSLATR